MILLIGSDDALLEGLSQLLAGAGHRIQVAHAVSEAEEMALPTAPLLVVVDRASVLPDNGERVSRIPLAPGGKFIWDHDKDSTTNPIPMIVPQVNGNINGTSVGQVPNGNPGVPNGLDTLCYPQHVGYTSDFKLMVNLGGALADTSWMDAGQPAMISYHVPTDNFAPYTEGIVNVPGTPLQVVNVQGSYIVQHFAHSLGNNAAFDALPFESTNQAAAFANSPAGLKDVTPGLYPFNMPTTIIGGVPIPSTTAPWEWTS